MRPLPTFSALPRAFACRLSTALPQADEHSAAAAKGDVRHRFLRRVSELLRGGLGVEAARELALAEAPQPDQWELALVPVDMLRRLKGALAEVAFAIDVTTGEARVLGRALERRYDEAGRKPTEIVGSVDSLVLAGQGGAIVRDFKGRSHDRRPDQDEQLLAGGYAVCRVYRRRWVDLEIVRIIDGQPFPMKARVAAADLERFGRRLRGLAAHIEAGRAAFARGEIPPATVGDHCRYCDRLRYCPAKLGLARAALGGDLLEVLQLARRGAPLIDETTAPQLRDALVDVERVVKRLKADLADFARQTPFRQRDGRVYGLTRGGRVAAHRPVDGRGAAKRRGSDPEDSPEGRD